MLNELILCLDDSNCKLITYRDKSTGKEHEEMKYDNDRELEYSLVTLSKKIEENLGIELTSVVISNILEMLSTKPLKTWQQ